MAFTIETCTAQYIGDRSEQQDRVGLFAHPTHKGTLLAVLADGMGGHTGGAMAAEQVIQSAKNNFESRALNAEGIQATLAASINDTHDGIKLTAMSGEADPHSTVCLLILQPGRANWAHCGDSRIYHYRDGARVSRTYDHSHVLNLMKMGYLTEAQAETHPQKNLLISCLGDNDPPKIYFSDEELGRVLDEFPVRQATEILINSACDRAKGYGENCSLAIVRLKEIEEDKNVPLSKKPATK